MRERNRLADQVEGVRKLEQSVRDALDLVEGRLGFAIENGKLKMSRILQEEANADAEA